MTTTYNPNVHNFVLFSAPMVNGSFERPCAIVLHTEHYVWVSASYADALPTDVLMVGDGRSTGYGTEGEKIVSVPVSYIKSYLDEDEAQSVCECMDADERLLSYAL